MPKIGQGLLGYSMVVLCFAFFSASKGQNNALLTKSTSNLPSMLDRITGPLQSTALNTTADSQTSYVTGSSLLPQGPLSLLDTDVDTDSLPHNMEDSTRIPSVVGGHTSSQTVLQQTALAKADNKTSLKQSFTQNYSSTTKYPEFIATLLLESPLVSRTATDKPHIMIETNTPESFLSDNTKAYTEPSAKMQTHFSSEYTHVPHSVQEVHHVMVPRINISPELDDFDVTGTRMMLDQGVTNDQSIVNEVSVPMVEETFSSELVTQSDIEINPPGRPYQHAGSSVNMDELTTHDIQPKESLTTSYEMTSTEVTSILSIPTIRPEVEPVIISETTSEPLKGSQQESVMENQETVVVVDQSTAQHKEDTPATEPSVETSFVHILHGDSTLASTTQFHTDDPYVLDILAVTESTERSHVPDTSSAVRAISYDENEVDSTTELVTQPTVQDAQQMFSTITYLMEESLSPELYPELTVRRNRRLLAENKGLEIGLPVPYADCNTTSNVSCNNSTLLTSIEVITAAAESNITQKEEKDLTVDERDNSVTVIFHLRELKKEEVTWYEEQNQLFRLFVADTLNEQERMGWPELYKSNGSFIDRTVDTAKRRKRNIETGLLPEDLVYVSPSPVVEEKYVYVVFFVRNSSTPDPCDVVLGQKIVHALNMSRLRLEEKMQMNVTRISTGIFIAKHVESFFIRHALIFIVLLATVLFCTCVIGAGLLYLRCRYKRGNWRRNKYPDQKMLQKDMKGQATESGDVNPGNNIENDEPQMTEKNGNGNYVIFLGDDDGWVVPFDDLMPTHKGKHDFEDTKL